MTARTLIILVKYVYPEKVSARNIKDKLEFRFLLPEFIIDQNTGMQIDNSTALIKGIPLQLRYDRKLSRLIKISINRRITHAD